MIFFSSFTPEEFYKLNTKFGIRNLLPKLTLQPFPRLTSVSPSMNTTNHNINTSALIFYVLPEKQPKFNL